MIHQDISEVREEARRTIQAGGVIAFRTDTFYGLGVDPFNAEAVRKVKGLKGREDNKPILLLISEMDQVDRFVDDATSYKAIAARYWPGPLTLIDKSRPEVPEELTAGSNSIGLRLPDDETVVSLVRACGGALTATSANPSGNEPARSAQQVVDYFGDRIDLIIDGGEVAATEPSTVADIRGGKLRVIREGAIKL